MGQAKIRKALGLPPRTHKSSHLWTANETTVTWTMVQSDDPFISKFPEARFLSALFDKFRTHPLAVGTPPEYTSGLFFYPRATLAELGEQLGWTLQHNSFPQSALVKCAWDVDTPREWFVSMKWTFDGSWTPVKCEPFELPSEPWDAYMSKDATGRIIPPLTRV